MGTGSWWALPSRALPWWAQCREDKSTGAPGSPRVIRMSLWGLKPVEVASERVGTAGGGSSVNGEAFGAGLLCLETTGVNSDPAEGTGAEMPCGEEHGPRGAAAARD